MYVFRQYCLQLIMYSGSAQGVVERVVNVRYYYYYYYSSPALFFFKVEISSLRTLIPFSIPGSVLGGSAS